MSPSLKLHITTPNGVEYNQFVKLISVKVHDGYRGVNVNQLPTIERIEFSQLKIFTDDFTNPQIFIIGDGIMRVDKHLCQIYTSMLIDPDKIDDNNYFKSNQAIVKSLSDESDKEFFYKKELEVKEKIYKMKKLS